MKGRGRADVNWSGWDVDAVSEKVYLMRVNRVFVVRRTEGRGCAVMVVVLKWVESVKVDLDVEM